MFPVWGARDGSGVLSLGQESRSAVCDEQSEIFLGGEMSPRKDEELAQAVLFWERRPGAGSLLLSRA